MSDQESWPAWVWVITEQKGSSEGIYALEGSEDQGTIIPVFRNPEDAGQVKFGLAKNPGSEYQVEAMRIELAAAAAREHHADLCFVDGEGKITERLAPIPEA